MRKITLLSVLFFSFTAMAQITYTSADFATADEEFTVSTANASLSNFAATGANYNWDFSNLTAASQATTGWNDPNDAGYKFSWCLSHFYILNCNSQFNSNFKLASPIMDDIEFGDYTISNIVEHTNVNASGVANKMRGMTTEIAGIPLPLTIDYDDPDEIYNFPMVYGDTYTNTGHFVLDLSNLGMDFSYSLTTNRTNTVQGWGSLTTPMGVFPDVLKIKCVTQRTDEISFSGITIPIPTTSVSYQWFSKDYGIPVLQADGFELFNIFIPTAVKYLDEQLCLTANAAFSYLPTADYNPDTQSATVAFNNQSTNYTSVSWDFGDGQSSAQTAPAHNYNCPGTYNVTLTVTNNVCAPTTTDVITMPVTITDSQNALTAEVTLENNTLTAMRSVPGTTYQWIDCDNANAVIDGATGQTFTPTASGNYACMMSTNGCDATSACTTVELCVALDADANFEMETAIDYDPQTASASLELTNLSENYTSVTWDFGDGNTSDEITPSHSYACPGTYDVTLTVTNDACSTSSSDSMTMQVTVTDSQNALTAEVTLENNTLTAVRSVAGTTYQWIDCDNANAAIDGATGQTFTPTASGNYACMMSTNGCDATSACTTVELCVALDADANFEMETAIDYDPQTASASLELTNLSENYTSVTWDFGDGNTSDEITPSHSYACPGTYDVTLTVTNDACSTSSSDSMTMQVTVTDSQNALTHAVTFDGTTITAVREVIGTTYQWIDCDNENAPIDGATGQSFSPIANGNYACMMSTNGCDAISPCTTVVLLGIGEQNAEALQIYPNPTTGQLFLSGAIEVKDVSVFNVLGMKVSNQLDLSGQASGMYFVRITADSGTFIRKVIKK